MIFFSKLVGILLGPEDFDLSNFFSMSKTSMSSAGVTNMELLARFLKYVEE